MFIYSLNKKVSLNFPNTLPAVAMTKIPEIYFAVLLQETNFWGIRNFKVKTKKPIKSNV